MQVTIYPRGNARIADHLPATFAETVHMSDYGEILSVRFSTRHEQGFGGHDLCTWVLAPYGEYAGAVARPADPVIVTHAGAQPWEGQLAEATPQSDGTVEFTARGFGYDLYDYLSVYFNDATSAPDLWYPTTDFEAGFEYAKSLGLPVRTLVGAPGEAVPTVGQLGSTPVAEGFLSLGELLTARLSGSGWSWDVWGRTLVVAPDEVAVTYTYDAPTSVVGIADSEYLTDVYVWYQAVDPAVDQNDYQFAMATDTAGLALFDRRMAGSDYRALGLMADHEAQALATSLLEKTRGRFVFTGTVEVDGNLAQNGGNIGVPCMVRAGKVMRIPEMRTSQGTLMPDGSTQFVIGRTEFQWAADGSERLTITPKGAVPRDINALLEPPKPVDPVAEVVSSWPRSA